MRVPPLVLTLSFSAFLATACGSGGSGGRDLRSTTATDESSGWGDLSPSERAALVPRDRHLPAPTLSSFSRPWGGLPPEDARRGFEALMDSVGAESRESVQGRALLHRWSRAMREAGAPSAAASTGLATGPYFDFVVSEAFGDLRAAAYSAAHAAEYARNVEGVTLETLFDAFLESTAAGTLEPAMAEAGRALGSCLARKALAARGPGCPLEETEARARAGRGKPGVFKKVWHKVRCGSESNPSSCATRRMIFQLAVPELMQARETPAVKQAVAQAFEERFPVAFRAGFLEELGARRKAFGALIGRKAGIVDALEAARLAESAPWLERFDRLGDFAQATRLELRVADALAGSSDARERAWSALLLVSAVQKLLTLAGVRVARWNGQGYGAAGEAGDDLERVDVGGWGFRVESFHGPVRAARWGLGEPAEGVRFPHRISLDRDARWIHSATDGPVEERLSDLAELVALGAAWLDLLNGPAARWFLAPGADLRALTDPERPELFPADIRGLGLATLGAALSRVIDDESGHIDRSPAPGRDLVLGVALRETVTSAGFTGDVPSTETIATLVRALDQARQALETLPDLRALLPSGGEGLGTVVDTAVDLGALALVGRSLDASGAFLEHPGVAPGRPFRLHDAVTAMRALTRAYQRGGMPAQRLALRAAWSSLERHWDERRTLPSATVPLVQTRGLMPEDGLGFLALLRETSAEVRSDLAPARTWQRWERRADLAFLQLVLPWRAEGPRMLTPR